MLLATIIDAALIDKYFHGRLVLSLADIPKIWQFPTIYLSLLAAAIVAARLLDYKAKAKIVLLSYSIPVAYPCSRPVAMD